MGAEKWGRKNRVLNIFLPPFFCLIVEKIVVIVFIVRRSTDHFVALTAGRLPRDVPLPHSASRKDRQVALD